MTTMMMINKVNTMTPRQNDLVVKKIALFIQELLKTKNKGICELKIELGCNVTPKSHPISIKNQ